MGLDVSNIYQVIHLSPSKNVASYIQETGRASRDGKQARALLIPASMSHSSKEMMKYTRTRDMCLREFPFVKSMHSSMSNPLSKCRCCSVCRKLCGCGSCVELNCIYC